MKNKIRQLSAEVVSKIAAGEVIDRPDSVVKELVENSLDAGAKKIEIYLDKGGMKRIEVRDNGFGMDVTDLKNSYLPHTTSKLSDLTDLETIHSFGFRGEALASMVAVAKVTLESRTKNKKIGHRLVVKGSQLVEDEKMGMPIGTRIVVESLFSGLPARKKFINKIQRELSYILKRITNFSLANYSVHFIVYHDQKKLFEVLPQNSFEDRVAELFGKDFIDQSLSYELNLDNDIKINGLIGKPQLSRHSPSKQFLFINGRMIRHRKIAKAIRDAYGPLLEPKAYPVFVIFISLPSHFFDTNIHPRKEEVLLFKEDELITTMFDHLQSFLLAKDLTYVLNSESLPTGYILRDRATTDTLRENLNQGWQLSDDNLEFGEVFQFQKTYLFFELNGELIAVDQHAAHEMILYQNFYQQLKKNKLISEKKIEINKKINLDPENLYIFKENKDIFENLGLIFSINKNQLIIRKIPLLFEGLDIERVLADFLADITTYGKVVKPALLTNRALSFLACRSAIKAGDYLNQDERQKIVKKIIKENTLYTCPHGRPLKIKISKKELEKMFFRKK